MNLRGQHRESGYAMAALLVAMSVMAVLASAAMPVWKHMSQREKEAELVFRGQQYARAIGLFQRKMGPGVNPPTIDVLVEQRFLRKKYKDPITDEDFEPVVASATAAAAPGTLPGGTPAGRGQTPPSSASTPSGAGRGGFGGVVGVMSKSKAASIRIYNGRTHYNEWQFVYIPQVQSVGGVAGGVAGQAGRGQRGGMPQAPGPGGSGRDGRGGPPPIGGPGRGGSPFPPPQRPLGR
jgi:type II secretory pathway pseudopilin PulG